jgi:hypothetical protein
MKLSNRTKSHSHQNITLKTKGKGMKAKTFDEKEVLCAKKEIKIKMENIFGVLKKSLWMSNSDGSPS